MMELPHSDISQVFPIRALDGLTPGLADYLEDNGDQASWDGFGSHQGGAAKRELAEKLYSVQYGLCGYCEINIIERNRQVEHVTPQSDPRQGKARTLDPTNMMICCKGGTQQTSDDAQYLRPIKYNRSCGEAKGDSLDPQFIDPRDLPSLPSLVSVNYETGEIIPDAVACAKARINVNSLEANIQATLKLNVPHLKEAWKQHWANLNAIWGQHLNDPQMLEEAVRTQLLPGEDSCLKPFFSTSRSYFGQVAEKILAETPQEWISVNLPPLPTPPPCKAAPQRHP